MSYKLVAIDVDGTLLDDSHKLSDENKKSIQKLLKNDIKVILFSGRGYSALSPLIESLGLKDAVATQNGSLILDVSGKRCMHKEMISPEDCRKILLYCTVNGYCPLIYQGDEVYGGLKGKYLNIFETCMDQKVIYTEMIEECYRGEPLGKILVLDDPERIQQVQTWIIKTFQERVSAELAYDFSLEIGGSDKGRALKWLASYYQIPREEIMAIGDGENDKGMLQFAGLGIAMAGAMENVRELAGYVTLSNNDSGVAHAIRTFM